MSIRKNVQTYTVEQLLNLLKGADYTQPLDDFDLSQVIEIKSERILEYEDYSNYQNPTVEKLFCLTSDGGCFNLYLYTTCYSEGYQAQLYRWERDAIKDFCCAFNT